MLTPILLAMPLWCVQAPHAPVAPILDWVEVELSSRAERLLLRDLATDIDDHFRGHGVARIFADDAEQARLRRAGLRLHVLQEDLTRFYAERAASEQHARSGGNGSFAGYRTLAEMELCMNQMPVIYPQVVSQPIAIGATHEGRTIWALRLSNTPTQHDPTRPLVWFDGLHHGREPMSGEAVLRFAEWLAAGYGNDPEVTWLLDRREVILIPCVNPDGYEFNRLLAPTGGGMWRKNKRANADGTTGVDLNRNYDWEWGPIWPGSSPHGNSHDYHGPAAFSEPETHAMSHFAGANLPALSVSAHSFTGSWIFPWGYDTVLTADDAVFRSLAEVLAEPLGWRFGAVWEALYTANGSSIDWQYGKLGTIALGVEVGEASDGFWPPPSRIGELFDQVRPSFVMALKAAGAWVVPELGDPLEGMGDGDPWPEVGELWSVPVTLTNRGLLATTGRIELRAAAELFGLSSAPRTFELAPGASENVQLGFSISPEARLGHPYPLRVLVEYDDFPSVHTVPIVVGEERILGRDAMEVDDFGWQVTATGGAAWERADPDYVYDSNSGEVAQPDTDASGASGGKCWVTGAVALGSPDLGDVDGVTQLVSPRFRAHGFEHLALEYSRWFSSLPGSAPADDFLRVDISSDDGATWVELESSNHSNSWVRKHFDLERHITLSDAMRVRFRASDDPDNGVTEALIDEFELRAVSVDPLLGLWGSTAAGDRQRLSLHYPQGAGGAFRILRSTVLGPETSVPGIEGTFHLGGTPRTLATGVLDSQGYAEVPMALTPLLHPFSNEYHLQLVADEGGPSASWSNLVSIPIE